MQALYQLLSLIFLREFIKLNANAETMIKNVTYGIIWKVCDCFLE